ncbi:MAG: QueT transporter family protein [Oscillospiraceae bacterium]
MNRKKINFLVTGAVIAALYAALTYAASAFGLAYGSIQFRFSEALTILPIFTPAAIPGLAIGCFLGNLASPFGMLDIVLGTLATLIAAVLTYFTRKIKFKNIPFLAPIFPVITNAIIIGLEISFFMPEGFTFAGFFISAMQVAIGEMVVCYALGLPLAVAIEKSGINKIVKM